MYVCVKKGVQSHPRATESACLAEGNSHLGEGTFTIERLF
jgi:hypothetical protein